MERHARYASDRRRRAGPGDRSRRAARRRRRASRRSLPVEPRLAHLVPQLLRRDPSERPVMEGMGPHHMTHRDKLVHLARVEPSGISDVSGGDEEDGGEPSSPQLLRRAEMVLGAVVERHGDRLRRGGALEIASSIPRRSRPDDGSCPSSGRGPARGDPQRDGM